MSRRRHRESDDELVLRGAVLSVFLVGIGAYLLWRPVPSGSPVDGILAAFVESARLLAWPSICLGVVLAVITAVLWRRMDWQRHAFARTGVTRADLQRLSPSDFEKWCAARLREQGYSVQEVGRQGDHGIDLIAERGAERTIVQCKRWNAGRVIGEPQIRDLFGAMHDAGADRAMVITTGLFTEAASAWAEGKPILLWDVDRVVGDARPVTAGPPSAAAAVPICERCGRAMVKRANRASGEAFWGCASFPQCRYTRPI